MEKKNAKSLKEVLEAYRPEGPDFGEKAPGPKRKKPDGSEQLRRDLLNVSVMNRNYFRICVASLLVVFAGACLLVLRSLDKPTQVAAIFGASGISLLGIITLMIKLWKQKVSTDMMLALAGSLRPQDFKGLVEIIL